MTTTNKIKDPFSIVIMDKNDVEVKNPFSGESVMLTPQAVAVYDCIIGAEQLGESDIMEQGLDWFREHYPKEYMVLLD
jgi:hypothetical protein